MMQVVVSYLIGMLFIANAGEATSTFLTIADWVFAVLFVTAGSIAGWQNARR